MSWHENRLVSGAASYIELRRGVKGESNKRELEYVPPMESYSEIVRYEGLEGGFAGFGAVGIRVVGMKGLFSYLRLLF